MKNASTNYFSYKLYLPPGAGVRKENGVLRETVTEEKSGEEAETGAEIEKGG